MRHDLSGAPGIFWSLLEERRLALGLLDPLALPLALAGASGKEDPFTAWSLEALLALTAIGAAWAVPAVYQRWGTPFLAMASLALQCPTLAIGAALWRDRRTERLGALFTTAAVALTPLTVLSLQCLALSLGFFPPHPRGWFPEPFALVLNSTTFPRHQFYIAVGTGAVATLTFIMIADVPHLAALLVAALFAAVHTSSALDVLIIRLNRAVLGPGKLGLRQADVWVDLGLAVGLLLAAVLFLAASWAFEPALEPVPVPLPAPPLTAGRLTAEELTAEDARTTVVRGGAGGAACRDQSKQRTQGRPEHRWRHFLAIVCDCAVVVAWVSFSRVDKEHSDALEMMYGASCAVLVLLALLLRRRSLLVGALGIAWYHGWRVVDVWSRSKHYARSLLLFDDACVLLRCVDPLKSRPDAW